MASNGTIKRSKDEKKMIFKNLHIWIEVIFVIQMNIEFSGDWWLVTGWAFNIFFIFYSVCVRCWLFIILLNSSLFRTMISMSRFSIFKNRQPLFKFNGQWLFICCKVKESNSVSKSWDHIVFFGYICLFFFFFSQKH